MRMLGILLSIVAAFGAICAEGKPAVTVMAAASLSESFKEIGVLYEAKYGKASFSFGASNKLRAQLENGARADVFASANRKEMDAAVKAGLIDAPSVRIFARNKLAILAPKGNPGGVKSPGDLAKPGLKVVVAAEAVPVGKYTLEMLEKLAANPARGATFKDKVLANVVSREENVKSVVTKVRLGEVDAGVAYVSDISGDAQKELVLIEVPDDSNVIAEYPLAPLLKALNAEGAAAFIKIVLSDEGQAILAKRGFIAVAGK